MRGNLKKFLISGLIIITTASAIAQGTVNFRNNLLFPKALVYLGDPSANIPLVGTNYVAELWAGVDQSSLAPVSGSISQFREPTTTAPGTWIGKTLRLPIGGVNVPITLQMRVWDPSVYTTYAASSAAGYGGSSTPFTYTELGGQPDPPTDRFMKGLTSFGVVPVPEPATILLSLLGAGSLLLRRK